MKSLKGEERPLTATDKLAMRKQISAMEREAAILMKSASEIQNRAEMLSRILHASPVMGKVEMNAQVTKEVSTEAFEPSARDRLTLERVPKGFCDLILLLAARYNITISALMGRSRSQNIVLPRHMAMFVMLEAGLSSVSVAKIFDRDHSTVLHARARHPKRMKEDPIYREEFQKLCAALQGKISRDLPKPIERRCEGCNKLFRCGNLDQVTCSTCVDFDTKLTRAFRVISKPSSASVSHGR
jgi:chromosomal replication initiation ATPase DnaA